VTRRGPSDDSGGSLSFPLAGLLALGVTYIVWGSTYLAIRVAVREDAGWGPFWLGAARVGVAAAFLTGEPTTLGCLLGLLAVLAIAVRNGITLVRYYRSLEKREGGFTSELVVRGTTERVGPILTTALVTAAALLPALFMGGVAGLEILHPMAITVLGGLVTSTLVSLVVVPGLYLADGGEVEPDVLVEEEPPRLVA